MWWIWGLRVEEICPALTPIWRVGVSTLHSLNSSNKQPGAWLKANKTWSIQHIKIPFFPGSQSLQVSGLKFLFIKTMRIELSNLIGQMFNTLRGRNSLICKYPQ